MTANVYNFDKLTQIIVTVGLHCGALTQICLLKTYILVITHDDTDFLINGS